VLQRGTGAGDLDEPGVGRGVASHPVCGDQLQLTVQCRADVVTAVRWRAAACPATTAVAALAAEVLPGVAIAAAPAALRAAIAALGGLGPTERHAEALLLRAFAAATGGGQ
jgi:NifU-like protein involved in Fe-S cluster formation